MSTYPEISVLMSVYNGEKYLREAVDSILNQTFKDFEFIIINDGSIDNTKKKLELYKDKRIRLIHQGNIGLTKSLNKGIKLAKGKYIARMDADDICDKNRLSEQFSFMESNSEIAVCGTWVSIIGDSSDIWKYPLDHVHICCNQLFSNSIAHPSAIIRTTSLLESDLLYNEKLHRSQDYDFWVRIAKKYKLANIGKVLLQHRIHSLNLGTIHKKDQNDTADQIRKNQLENLGIKTSKENIELHSNISKEEYISSTEFIKTTQNWLEIIDKANEDKLIFDKKVLKKELAFRWWIICNNSSALGMVAYFSFWNCFLSKHIRLNLRQKIFFFIKCGIKYGRK